MTPGESLQVEAALSEEAQERQSVSDLKEQLAALQAEVHYAHERLHATQVLFTSS